MFTATDSYWYHINDIANLFLKSEYNTVCFDGSDLFQQVKGYLLTNHKFDRKVSTSEDYMKKLTSNLIEYFQREIRYRFDD